MGGADAGGGHGTRGQRMAVTALLLGFNMTAIAAVSAWIVPYISEGIIDDALGYVVIGLVTGVFVSIISTSGYDHLKMAFGLNKWQERMEASQKRMEAKQDTIIRTNKDIADLLRTYLPLIAAALGVKVPPSSGGKADGKDADGAASA